MSSPWVDPSGLDMAQAQNLVRPLHHVINIISQKWRAWSLSWDDVVYYLGVDPYIRIITFPYLECQESWSWPGASKVDLWWSLPCRILQRGGVEFNSHQSHKKHPPFSARAGSVDASLNISSNGFGWKYCMINDTAVDNKFYVFTCWRNTI